MKHRGLILGGFFLLALATFANTEDSELSSCVALPHVDGESRSICDRAQKDYLILEFFLPNCPACIRNAPQFLKLELQAQAWAHARLISARGLHETLPFINRFHITSDVALDERSRATREYNIRQFPTTLVLDSDNRVIYRSVGILHDEEIQAIVDLVSPRNE